MWLVLQLGRTNKLGKGRIVVPERMPIQGAISRRLFVRASALASLALTTRAQPKNVAQKNLKSGPSGRTAYKHERPPVIMIVLDTVRADHTSAWGYKRHTTPQLEKFAEHATRYTQAVAPAPWTLPSHASLFTGLYPFEHNARTRLLRTSNGELSVTEPPLEEKAVTIAEILRANGYSTGAFIANTGFMHERFNLCQGFQKYDVDWQPGTTTADKGLEWIDQQSRQPFFAFFNFMDAHWPYNTHSVPGVGDFDVSRDTHLQRTLLKETMPGSNKVDPSLVDKVTRQYDLGIANVDAAWGHLLQGLKERNVYDEAIVVVTSDHGEFLGEHHLVAHSKDVYQPTAWIPLLFKRPGQRTPEISKDRASLCMVPSLILSQFSDQALGQIPRHFLQNAMAEKPILCENYYSRKWDFTHKLWGHRFKRRRTALYDGSIKFIHSSDGAHEVYDLAADADESENLAQKRPDLVDTLTARLCKFKPLDTQDKPLESDEEPMQLPADLAEEMQALGYLGD
ncbi:MAG: sulfatase [Candidatus Hydrogenedentota bacterium]